MSPTSPVRRRHDCRICGSKDLTVVLPLKPIPVVTPNIKFDDAASAGALGLAGLDVFRCNACVHLQLLDLMDPRFQYSAFQYTTSVSRGLDAHFAGLGAELEGRLVSFKGKQVLEIGSNDGTLLQVIKDKGARVLGIDPAEKAGGIANDRGIETIIDFFVPETAGKIRAKYGAFDVILCNYTMANIDDLTGFAAGVNALLADDGMFVVETSYGFDVLESRLLDTIHHEHLSFFLVTSLRAYAHESGWELVDVQHIPTKGGSVRAYFRRAAAKPAIAPAVAAFIDREIKAGVKGTAPYDAFMATLADIEKGIFAFLADHRGKGPIVAFGSAIGSVPLMSQFGLWPHIDCIADDTPLASALVNGTRKINVIPTRELAALKPAAIVLLAWRYADGIRKSLRAAGLEGTPMVVPFPEVHRLVV